MRLVKFQKPNCQGCMLSEAYMNSIGFDKELEIRKPYEVADDAEFASDFEIMSLPAFLLFSEDGKLVERMDGFSPNRTNELDKLLKLYK